MGHKAAKRVRQLLKATLPEQALPAWQAREYTENENRRKKQLVELKTGEQKEIEVSLGQLTLKPGSGRAVYKVIKKAMAGQAKGENAKPRTNYPVAMTKPVKGHQTRVNPEPELLPAPAPTFIETEE